MTHWLLGTLLATSGLMLVVLLSRELVRRHFGARAAYGLWLIPAARLLMPTLTRTVERPAVGASAILKPDTSIFAMIGSWQTLVVALWIAGAIGLFVIRMLEFAHRSSAILSAAIEVDRVGSIRIVRTGAVRGPMSFGLFDRVIALPADFETRYGENERALALSHELAHHRSGDLIVNFAAFVLLCLQWFNPLAWLAYSAFRFDQEAACDVRVLERGGRNRGDYGRVIAKAASGQAFLLAAALDRRSLLTKRLECLLSAPAADRRLVGKLVVMTALAAALPLTANHAITYVDAPIGKGLGKAHLLNTRISGTLMRKSTPPEAVGERRMQAEQVNSAGSTGPQVVQRQIESEEVQDEPLYAIQAQRDQEQARRDIEQAQRDPEEARRSVEQARTDEQEARVDEDRARDESELRRPSSEPSSVTHIDE